MATVGQAAPSAPSYQQNVQSGTAGASRVAQQGGSSSSLSPKGQATLDKMQSIEGNFRGGFNSVPSAARERNGVLEVPIGQDRKNDTHRMIENEFRERGGPGKDYMPVRFVPGETRGA